jgi:hypothetical protein
LEEAISAWIITSLTHDWGYIFEWGDISNANHANESISVLKSFEENPIPHFFHSVGASLLKPQMTKIVNNARPQVVSLESYSSIFECDGFSDCFKQIECIAFSSGLGEVEAPLTSYFNFKKSISEDGRHVFIDHGIACAHILIWLALRNNYWKNLLIDSLRNHSSDDLSECVPHSEYLLKLIIKCSSAIALHNIHVGDIETQNKAYSDYKLTLNRFKIRLESNPLAFLLILSDTLQEWDRPSFMPDADKDFQAQDIHILSYNNSIHLCFPGDVLACLGTGNSRFEKMIVTLNKLVDYDRSNLSMREFSIEELTEQVKNSEYRYLLNGGVFMAESDKTQANENSSTYAYELYKKGRRAANEANWDTAIKLQSQAAELFANLDMRDWQSRALGRVVCSEVFAGKSEKTITETLEEAYNTDCWQGLLNYYWALDHALKTKASQEFKLYLLDNLIHKWEICGICDAYRSLKTKGYIALLDGLLLFFDKLLDIERNSKWPSWALSDIPRLDVLKAERSITTASAYLKSAAEKYDECDLTSYASWSRCKISLLNCLNTSNSDEILSELTSTLVLGRRILQSPDNERNTVKFFLTVVGFYREILCSILEDDYKNTARYSYYLKALETYDIDEKDLYLNTCNSLIQHLESEHSCDELCNMVVTEVHHISEDLPWLESSKLRQLVSVYISEKVTL